MARVKSLSRPVSHPTAPRSRVLVHHRYVRVYATTLATISEDDGAGEPDAEDCEAAGEVCEARRRL